MKTYANIKGEDHRMVIKETYWVNEVFERDGVFREYSCTCGKGF
jgi:hypothetical protein